MKYLTISLLVLLTTLFCFTSINAQWYEKTNGLPDGWTAFAIDAYDSLIAVGPFYPTSVFLPPDSLYITTDGGNNWYAMTLPDSLTNLDKPIDISIIGKDKIWFCTGGPLTDGGEIYNTTDGGLTWQIQFYDTSMTKFINYIEMFDSLNGIAMGDAPADDKPALFLKTTNGGADWISQNDSSLIGLSSGDSWRRVNFADINTGYFRSSGEAPAKLYKTTNGGVDWEFISDTIHCVVLKAYDENIFLDEETGYLDRTLDGGQTWSRKKWDFMHWGNDIEYIPNKPSDVWLVSGNICFSSDTGRTWVEEFKNEDLRFFDIAFTDEENGWLLGRDLSITPHKSCIYRTTNGGHGGVVSVEDNRSNSIVRDFVLEQNYPNPFNPSTTIRFQIPAAGIATLKIYNILGEEVRTLVNEVLQSGRYELNFDATHLPSGTYIYRIQEGTFVEAKKMVLMK
jgi:photosystem II stability/assembly factor-like uncharacterized protein